MNHNNDVWLKEYSWNIHFPSIIRYIYIKWYIFASPIIFRHCLFLYWKHNHKKHIENNIIKFALFLVKLLRLWNLLSSNSRENVKKYESAFSWTLSAGWSYWLFILVRCKWCSVCWSLCLLILSTHLLCVPNELFSSAEHARGTTKRYHELLKTWNFILSVL